MEKETLNFVVKKYELSFRNVEFLDSYVPKMLAIYAAFLSLMLINIEKILSKEAAIPFVLAFIFIVTATVLFLLKRISYLVGHQKETVRKIEEKVQIEHDLSLVNRALPESWEKGFSTARISRYAVFFMSATVLGVIAYAAYFG